MFSLFRITAAVVCLLAAVCLHALVCGNSLAAEWELLASLLSLAPLATSFSGGPGVQDANLSATTALPSAANATTTQATGFDTEASGISDFVALAELLVTAPALNTTQLPNAATMTYNLVASANANLAGATIVQQSVIVQLGAGGAGAAGATARARLPTNIGTVGRYVGLQQVGAVSNGNCAAASGKLQMLF